MLATQVNFGLFNFFKKKKGLGNATNKKADQVGHAKLSHPSSAKINGIIAKMTRRGPNGFEDFTVETADEFISHLNRYTGNSKKETFEGLRDEFTNYYPNGFLKTGKKGQIIRL